MAYLPDIVLYAIGLSLVALAPMISSEVVVCLMVFIVPLFAVPLLTLLLSVIDL